MLAWLLMKQIAVLFLMMGAGFLIVKKGLLKSSDSQVLSLLTIYLITPAVILNAFQIEYTPEIRDGFLLAVFAAVCIHLFLLLFTKILGNYLALSVVDKASIIYSNAGNLVIPLVSALLGKEWLIYASGYMFVQLFFLWTQGAMMMGHKNEIALKTIFMNINLLSILLGLLFFSLKVQLPTVLTSTLDGLANMIGPLSMVMLGMMIAGANDGWGLFNWEALKVVGIKMLVSPIIVLVFLKYAGLQNLVESGETILLISLIATSTPSATMIVQLAQLYQQDVEQAGKINLLTTLICILTMPIIVYLYLL